METVSNTSPCILVISVVTGASEGVGKAYALAVSAGRSREILKTQLVFILYSFFYKLNQICLHLFQFKIIYVYF